MKHLNTYNDFNPVQEGWLSDKLSKASESIKGALSGFTKPFNDIVKKVRTEWKENFDAETVRNELIDILNKSFEDMIKSIDKMDNVDDVEQIYDDADQAIIQFNDALNKEIDKLAVSESIKTYKGYFTQNEAQEATMAGLKAAVGSILNQVKDALNDGREEYLNSFKDDDKAKEEKSLDTKKEDAKNYLKDLSKDIELKIKDLDIKKLVDDAKAKVETRKSTEDKGKQEYAPGTILKYTKKDGKENTAEVANSQKDAEEGFINMLGEDGKSKFVINKERIIGEADEDGDVEVTPDDITNSLEDIKGDKKAMNKLKKFIEDELQ